MSCAYSSPHDCYIKFISLANPRELIKNDVRDAIAYCEYVNISNDAQFCASVRQHYPQLLEAEQRELRESQARESRLRVAKIAALPKFIPMTAQGVSIIPDAIVCSDHDTTALMFDLYAKAWEDAKMDRQTRGQSRLISGPPMEEPDIRLYGCTMLAPGTPMILDLRNIIPVVAAQLPDGSKVRGVTLRAMIRYPDPNAR